MSWRHFPKVVELRTSAADLSVGEEFRRRRHLRRQEQLELQRFRVWTKRKRMEVQRG